MARADLLVKLVRAGSSDDKTLFRKVVESVIAEERKKQHHIIADQLQEVLSQEQKGSLFDKPDFRQKMRDEKADNFLLSLIPRRPLTDLIISKNNLGQVNEVIEEHHRSDLLRSYNLEPRNRILLTGAPGNGKTSLAEAIATTLMVPFYVVRYDGIIGSYLGETASRLNTMFEIVRQQECVLFFDEFDAIGKERGDTHETGEIKRVVSSLLLQIDRLPSYVIVIAATNHPELLDRAVWRRFQVKLALDKPEKPMIEAWLKRFEEKVRYSLQHPHKQIAAKLVGRSFSEIEDFMNDVQRKYILSLPEADVKRIVDECLVQLT